MHINSLLINRPEKSWLMCKMCEHKRKPNWTQEQLLLLLAQLVHEKHAPAPHYSQKLNMLKQTIS